MPQTYKAMCQQCGEIVQHRLNREQDETRPRSNGHLVPPTIARAMLLPPRPAGWKPGDDAKPAPRPYSRREVRAHNAKSLLEAWLENVRGAPLTDAEYKAAGPTREADPFAP